MQKKIQATLRSSRRHAALAGTALVAACGAGVWIAAAHHPARPTPKMVYIASGYGGFVPAPAPSRLADLKPQGGERKMSLTPDPVQPLRVAYDAGHYQAVEASALTFVAQAKTSRNVAVHEQAAEARSLLAYSAARRHDLKLAQARFAVARLDASKLPDKGKQAAEPGLVMPTLEEDAAYEHAVCTNALGHPQAAEAEYVAFMKQYPESPLVQASIRRIARMHGGDIPAADQTVWQQAQQTAQTRQIGREREASLCGPACLAELLRRRGDNADVHALADQMHTSDRGTTLAALADTATAQGFHPQGLALTPKGLAAQTLPVIALVRPGHYVLVDAVSASGVTLWDPDAHGLGHGGTYTVPIARWQHEWRGVTLILAPAHTSAAVQTAHR